jgi:GxxExxY protein
MNTDKHGSELVKGSLTYQIVGAAMEVLNDIGHGLHEKPYERALVVELRLRQLPVVQQRIYPVVYKGEQVGEFIPDLIVNDEVVVDTKTIEHITEHERGQMINYLRMAKKDVGLILNFKKSKLEWVRIVL